MYRQADALKIAHRQSKCGRFVGDPTQGNLDIDSRGTQWRLGAIYEFTTDSSPPRLRRAATSDQPIVISWCLRQAAGRVVILPVIRVSGHLETLVAGDVLDDEITADGLEVLADRPNLRVVEVTALDL